ncbi:MAG: diguanylate cyclase [Clostridiales bacterium]|nr:diguanylate cyclase [Clostridiales bacterium]
MKQGETNRSGFHEILRYFGVPLLAVIVVIIAFFATQKQVVSEIRLGTYQILRDATLNQRITLEKYIGLLTTRVELIADYDSDTGPNTLVESLRTELQGNAEGVEIGFANKQGDLLYSDQTRLNVGGEDWFKRTLAGETVITIASQNEDDGLADVLVSARVLPKSGVDGVLFATLNGKNFSAQLDTRAYDGAAFSFVCDSHGTILFAEDKESFVVPSGSIYDVINDQTLVGGFNREQLKKELGSSRQIQFRFRYGGEAYYAVCEAANPCGWYIISIVSGDDADYIQRHVTLYQMGMLFIMLLAGVSMAAQAYLHERTTVRKLEKDKDLLRQGAKRYQLITQLSNEVLFHIDLKSGEISFNDSFESMFGQPPPDCTIQDMERCEALFVPEDKMRFRAFIERLLGGAAEAHEELRMINARGAIRWKRLEIFSVFDQNGRVSMLVGKIADIQRQRQSMQRLIRQADSDPLTGLLNRGAMERSVKGFLAGEGVSGTHALLMMDFDNFKAVNDTLGHAKGDTLLTSFAVGMRRLFRSGDYLSRIGGDEYMVFLKDVYEDGVALEKAEALRAEMAALSRKIGIPVSISIGIAVYKRDGTTFEKLYKAADEALYQVKKTGKNAAVFASAPAVVAAEKTPAPDGEDN